MRISGHETINHSTHAHHAVRESREAAYRTPVEPRPPAGTSAADADKVEWSPRGRDIKRIQGILQGTPEVCEARIVEAKHAVETGTLNLHGPDLADKILADLQRSTGTST